MTEKRPKKVKVYPKSSQPYKRRPDPTLFLAHLQGTQSRHTKANLAKELKMPPHCPPTPADGIFMSFTLNISNITTINNPR